MAVSMKTSMRADFMISDAAIPQRMADLDMQKSANAALFAQMLGDLDSGGAATKMPDELKAALSDLRDNEKFEQALKVLDSELRKRLPTDEGRSDVRADVTASEDSEEQGEAKCLWHGEVDEKQETEVQTIYVGRKTGAKIKTDPESLAKAVVDGELNLSDLDMRFVSDELIRMIAAMLTDTPIELDSARLTIAAETGEEQLFDPAAAAITEMDGTRRASERMLAELYQIIEKLDEEKKPTMLDGISKPIDEDETLPSIATAEIHAAENDDGFEQIIDNIVENVRETTQLKEGTPTVQQTETPDIQPEAEDKQPVKPVVTAPAAPAEATPVQPVETANVQQPVETTDTQPVEAAPAAPAAATPAQPTETMNVQSVQPIEPAPAQPVGAAPAAPAAATPAQPAETMNVQSVQLIETAPAEPAAATSVQTAGTAPVQTAETVNVQDAQPAETAPAAPAAATLAQPAEAVTEQMTENTGTRRAESAVTFEAPEEVPESTDPAAIIQPAQETQQAAPEQQETQSGNSGAQLGTEAAANTTLSPKEELQSIIESFAVRDENVPEKAEAQPAKQQTEELRPNGRQDAQTRVKNATEELTMLRNAKLTAKTGGEEKTTELAQALEQLQNAKPILLRKADGGEIEVKPSEIIDQVQKMIERAVQESKERSEYSLVLNPEELGRITVKLIKAADGAVSVQIAAENAHTQRVLEQHADIMQNNLRNNGVNLESWQTVNESRQEAYAQDYNGSSKNPYFRREVPQNGDDGSEGERSFADIIASM